VDAPAGSTYVVQYKSEGSTVWNEVKRVPQPPCVIEDLKEGVTYTFRVALHNAAGLSEYSPESDPVKVAPSQKPVITKALKDVLVPKKEECRLECFAVGEPAPSYSWYKDGRELLPEEDNISISNEGYMSVLRIHRMGSPTAGVYRCEVHNTHGAEESVAKVGAAGNSNKQ